MEIQFYSDKHTPRLRYISDFILGQVLGLNIVYKTYPVIEQREEVICLEYGTQRRNKGSFFILAHSFLQQNKIVKPKLEIRREANLAYFFSLPEMKNADLHFDLFAMAFYLLSRFEEYENGVDLDKHGRFPAKASLAFQEDFLEEPLIDQWSTRFYELLQKRFPFLEDHKAKFRFQTSIDVDYAWCYLNKGWKRNIGGFLKAAVGLKWQELGERISVGLGREIDPFYTFDYLEKLHDQHDVESLFFILLANYGTYDKNIYPDHPAMKALVKKLESGAEMGIHPSYASNKKTRLLHKEKERLEKVLGKPVEKSRQHFLKLRFPATYRNLIEAGISEDYSMGYASEVGFRASTAHSFYWYDLEKEEATKLRVFPFAVMDVTLKDYLRLSPEEAVSLYQKLMDGVRKTGGEFIVIWHNSSFAESTGWAGWKEVYEKMLALGAVERVNS